MSACQHKCIQMSEIGGRLREERERLQLSQEEFGAVGGVARNAQSNYEKGKRMPDAAYLAAIARNGADVLYIVTGTRTDTSATAMSPDEARLLSVYRQCSKESRRHLLLAGEAFAGASMYTTRSEPALLRVAERAEETDWRRK